MEALIRRDTDVYFGRRFAFTMRGGSKVSIPWPKGKEFKIRFQTVGGRRVLRVTRRLTTD